MTKKDNKREKLLRSAKSLIHKKGYHKTTLADIADHSGITVGNVYYYFKTKKQIVQAIVDERTENFLALTKEWEKYPEPKNRLLAFLGMPSTIDQAIVKYGCPVGSLLQELNKNDDIESSLANRTIQAHMDWIKEQFVLMGKDDPDELAQHFMSTLQGGCLLANSMKNPEFLHSQINRLRNALEQGEMF